MTPNHHLSGLVSHEGWVQRLKILGIWELLHVNQWRRYHYGIFVPSSFTSECNQMTMGYISYIVYNLFSHKNWGTFQFFYYCKFIPIIGPFCSNSFFWGGNRFKKLALNGHKID